MRAIHTALTVALLGTVAVGGCQCITDPGLGKIPDEPDAGFDVVEVPPVFPLRAGDRLVISPIGGRTNEDPGGGAQIAGKITFDIKAVTLNADKRWTIGTDVLYEPNGPATITAAAISRLALENIAPFAQIEAGASESAIGAVFTTDVAPALDTVNYKPNNFPFFQGGLEGNDGDDGTVFNEAATAFRETILALDAEADVVTQLASGKFEAYFRDDLGGPPALHHLSATVHPMGFLCGWDEALVPFVEGSARNSASFALGGIPTVAAITFGAPSLTRDNVKYTCLCGIDGGGVCRNRPDGGGAPTCLDPTDPEAAPGPCP